MVNEAPHLGYRDPEYARSHSAIGTPLYLQASNGWLIERSIPGSTLRDAMGLYPVFNCGNWRQLPSDMQALRQRELVSLVLISDPMQEVPHDDLAGLFDIARPFKTHFIAELDRPVSEIVSRHHAYYARRAAQYLEVDIQTRPLAFLDEWNSLYSQLVTRHAIRDLRAFSKASFETLLGMPGLILCRALLHGQAVGAQLVLMQGETACSHLAAFTPDGYRHGASYLLDWHILEYLHGRAASINWGGGGNDNDGLAKYKQGWATRQSTSHLFGTIFDQQAYACLNKIKGNETTTYFPAYRKGEFG